MITLRELVRSDRAIAMISTDDCHDLAFLLDTVFQSWFIRLFLPRSLKLKEMSFRMLAATLGRTPSEREPDAIQAQIHLAMQRDAEAIKKAEK